MIEPGIAIRPESRATDAETIEQPAKVMRIGSMIKQLLDEVRAAPLDEPSRERLRRHLRDLGARARVGAVARPPRRARPPGPAVRRATTPSEAELRVAKAQLVGWLEGLFHGIQATLFAQQMAARQQLEQIRGQLPPGQGAAPPEQRPGTYL